MRTLWALALVPLLGGCATVKMTMTDLTTGGTWVIKQRPASSDEIYYCSPPMSGPVRCQEANTL